MKLFRDKELTEEISDINFGIVVAGESKSFTYYLYNEKLGRAVNIKTVIENNEVQVTKAPETLQAKESAEIELTWTPSITLEQGLRDVKFTVYRNEIFS